MNMIELHYYALAALDTYTASSNIELATNSHAQGLYRVSDFTNTLSRSSDVFCELYLYFTSNQAQQAVIAIRGTANLNNGWQDIKIWIDEITGISSHGKYPDYYMHKVINFYRDVQNYLNKKHPTLVNSISLCGHSLGGALAKLMVAKFDAPKAVVFNAPGISSLVEHPHHSECIYCIDSTYGIINKLGKHLHNMHMFTINIPEDSQAAKLLIQQFQKNGERKFLTAINNDMKHGGAWSHTKGILLELESLRQSMLRPQSIPGFKKKIQQCERLHHPNNTYNLYSVAKQSIELSECLLYQYINEYKDIISSQHSMSNLYYALLMPVNHALSCRMI
jgi:hypothetical protein